jgi:hypothetical protein
VPATETEDALITMGRRNTVETMAPGEAHPIVKPLLMSAHCSSIVMTLLSIPMVSQMGLIAS